MPRAPAKEMASGDCGNSAGCHRRTGEIGRRAAKGVQPLFTAGQGLLYCDYEGKGKGRLYAPPRCPLQQGEVRFPMPGLRRTCDDGFIQ